jgi:hypothetical protein
MFLILSPDFFFGFLLVFADESQPMDVVEDPSGSAR